MIDWLDATSRRNDAIRVKVPMSLKALVDQDGRIVLPPEVLAHYGLEPGSEVLIDLNGSSLRVRRPVTRLAKVYVEPTNRCNLTCRTCIRNNWGESLGRMSKATFGRIINGLRSFPPPVTVFFGGFGEPLAHSRIVDMIGQAKALGARVEIITNGTLLSEDTSRRLIDAGLDMLWVSLDGATPESYTDVRLAEALPTILDNLARFHTLRIDSPRKPELGIAFVAMQRNIGDLPALLRIGSRLDVRHYSVSGVLPHTEEMCQEALYTRTLSESPSATSNWAPQISLPRMDINELTSEALYRVLRSGRNVTMGGASLAEAKDRCPFIDKGSLSIAWDGSVSPCLSLLHSHTSFLNGRERQTRRHVVGNVNDRSLQDLWLSPDYVAFRRRVQEFEFSPCSFCGGCDLSEKNQEDCFGNEFPTCGGCLWAQGVIQCP
jgi:MoaA/NifB/PqqE/SkfB family radical SAM enzyme